MGATATEIADSTEGPPSVPGGRARPRVAIVHDFMEAYGGAERVTSEIAATFPGAPVYAILGRREVAERMRVADRFSSLLPPRSRLLRYYRLGTPAYPLLARSIRLPDADVLISSSYAFAHQFRTRNDAPHVSYCHGPLRFAWSMADEYRHVWASGAMQDAAFNMLAGGMRFADRSAAARVGEYLTGSAYTAGQIERYFGRKARVIGAPIDCDRFVPDRPEQPDDYYLFCGRLIEPYKRAEITIEAFSSLDERLVVVGDGPARARLEAGAPPNVEFRGALEDDELVSMMQRCKALVFPSRDDFGMLPLEVMACGRPVLAYAGGGALHTVVPGGTGEFFDRQTPDAIRQAVESFDHEIFDPPLIRAHAINWDRKSFRSRIRDAVAAVVG